jgi:helicase
MLIEKLIDYGIDREIVEKLQSRNIIKLTQVQQQALEGGLCTKTDLKILVSAPTSSGKTTVAELAIVKGSLSANRSIYLVTHKALAEEKYRFFKKEYGEETGDGKWFDVSIATGDRQEGNWDSGLLIATYEKYLSLLCASKNFNLTGKVIVADEIQILFDKSRGADVEILCSIIRTSEVKQLIALSATIPNAQDLADWLFCKHVHTSYRDVPLQQEVWFQKRYILDFGSELDDLNEEELPKSSNTLEVVKYLIEKKLSPVLVFTMTKKRTLELSELYARERKQILENIELSESIEQFSESTSLTKQLKETVAKKIAFHTAELSLSERSFVEKLLLEGKIDIVFATSTLAAGVNFPIQSVVFDSFKRSWESESFLPKGEYLNMSGRAGRLGFHEKGFSILICQNKAEEIAAKKYISKEHDPQDSVLLKRSMRKILLQIIASRLCGNKQEVIKFFESTFFWHRKVDSDQYAPEEIKSRIAEDIDWLLKNKLLDKDNDNLFPTHLGRTVAASSLLPSTATFILDKIKTNLVDAQSIDFEIALFHLICACDEFDDKIGQRHLPFANRNEPDANAVNFLKKYSDFLFVKSDSIRHADRAINATYAISMWFNGKKEGEIKKELNMFSYGQLERLGGDFSWILEGLAKIAQCPDSGLGNNLPQRFEIISKRVRYGAVIEATDILEAAQRERVEGFGRNRAMELVQAGCAEPNRLLSSADKDTIVKILGGKDRTNKLLEAVARHFSHQLEYWKRHHQNRAEKISQELKELITNSYVFNDTEYEKPIHQLLEKIEGWDVKLFDDGKRQGVPDFLITYQGKTIAIECKTKEKSQATVDKENAFAVIHKSANIEVAHCVTIGKPEFSTIVKSKVATCLGLTLVSHSNLIEMILRYLEKDTATSAESIFSWLTQGGVAIAEQG